MKDIKINKADYPLYIIAGLFVLSLFTFGYVVLKLNNAQQNTISVGENGVILKDPFDLPEVTGSDLVISSSNTAVFVVDGTVLEVVSEFLLRLTDSGKWVVTQPSVVPSALDYQEIVIQDENAKSIKVTIEVITEDKVRLTAIEV